MSLEPANTTRTCAVARLGPMWHRVDGVAAALSREDAIAATAVPLTRRDGPDAVREQLNIEKGTTPGIVRWTPRAHVVVSRGRVLLVTRF